MNIRGLIKQRLHEANYVVKSDDLTDVKPEIEKNDPEAIIKVIDEEETDESYNIYSICTSSISKTAGTSERSKWSDSDLNRYEKCVKSLKNKKGYKLGENIKNRDIIKRVKVKNLLK